MFFCANPFQRLEVHRGGEAFACCPSWLPKPLGNLSRQSLDEVWNSAEAQEIRASILDGSFRFCRKDLCPALQGKDPPVYPREQTPPEFQDVIREGRTELTRGPKHLNVAFDPTCNLSCPSCRNEVQSLKGEAAARADRIESTIRENLSDLEMLRLSGDGDPFASPSYFRFLRSLRSEDHPRLKIHLLTNALLLTPEKWAELAGIEKCIHRIEVSVDAATPETYAINRRGGRFDVLLRNLQFVSGLRRDGRIRKFSLNFLVQANNWREMRAFVELGIELGADWIGFNRLNNWGTYSAEDFGRRAVHLPAHPEHDQFREEIRRGEFDHPAVKFENLLELRA